MKTNLFCFPFAGGSKYSYNSFIKFASAFGLKITAFDYPGRGSRIKEPLLTGIHEIVDDCYEKIKNNMEEPYAIYGHSMGSVVSCLLVKKITQENKTPPLHVFLSGRGGPSIVETGSPRYLLSKLDFRNRLREMGGCPDEVLENEDLMDFFEPIIRADFQALETFKYQKSAVLDIPFTVMIGEEERVTYNEALAWQKETNEPIEVIQFPGKHFFIFSHAKEVVQIIGQKLSVENIYEKSLFAPNYKT